MRKGSKEEQKFWETILISFFLSYSLPSFHSFFGSFSFTMLAKKLQRVVACFKQFAIVVLKLTEDLVSGPDLVNFENWLQVVGTGSGIATR